MYDNKQCLELMKQVHDLINEKSLPKKDYAFMLREALAKFQDLNQMYGEDRPLLLTRQQYNMLVKLLSDDTKYYIKEEFRPENGLIGRCNGIKIIIKENIENV